MSIGQLAGTLLQDPLQGLFQQPAADPLTALLGGGGFGGGFGNFGAPVDPLTAMLGGQLNPTAGLLGGGGGTAGNQLMMTLVSLLLGENSPLDQFPKLNGNNQARQNNAAPARQAAPAQQAAPAEPPKPELPVVADKTSVKDGKVTLGKGLLEQVAKDPANAKKIVEQELQALGGNGKDPQMKVINLFRADNPSTHGHGKKSEDIYNNLINTVTESAVKQSAPFQEALAQEKAQKQAEAEAQAQANAEAEAAAQAAGQVAEAA